MPRAFSDTERERIRQRLFEVGLDALPRTGFRRTSVEDLARAAGISKGAFYAFFPAKEDLWIALLEAAERDARQAIETALRDPSPGRLDRVLTVIFDTVWRSPTLRALTDPEDVAWLLRTVEPERLAAARLDDDAWFRALWLELVRLGDGAADVDPGLFAGVPAVALAIAQHRAELGAGREDAVVRLVIDGLVLRLTPEPRRSRGTLRRE